MGVIRQKKKSSVIIVIVLQSIHVFGILFSYQEELSTVKITNSSLGSRSERKKKKKKEELSKLWYFAIDANLFTCHSVALWNIQQKKKK